MRISICLITLVMGFAPTAHSQVFKCAGPDGRMVYIDRPCSGETAGRMLLRERTFEEKVAEREQAYIAEMRKQERRAIEQEREMFEEHRRRREELRAMQERQYQPQHKGYEERLRERNASVQSTLRPPPRPARPPSHLTATPGNNPPGCDSNFCHDNMGGVYSRHGPNSTTMTRSSDGANCIITGSSVICP